MKNRKTRTCSFFSKKSQNVSGRLLEASGGSGRSLDDFWRRKCDARNHEKVHRRVLRTTRRWRSIDRPKFASPIRKNYLMMNFMNNDETLKILVFLEKISERLGKAPGDLCKAPEAHLTFFHAWNATSEKFKKVHRRVLRTTCRWRSIDRSK